MNYEIMKKPLDKLVYSPELKLRQINLRKFLRENKGIEWKELRPFGFSINVSTIPTELFDNFLEIANS